MAFVAMASSVSLGVAAEVAVAPEPSEVVNSAACSAVEWDADNGAQTQSTGPHWPGETATMER